MLEIFRICLNIPRITEKEVGQDLLKPALVLNFSIWHDVRWIRTI